MPVGGAGGQRHGVLGIDEAGRGSWVGPVVAAAAYILPEAYADARLRGGCHLIDDSKKLSRAEREALFDTIAQWRDLGLLRIAAGEASVAEIEAHNIVGATAIAMRRAVGALALPCGLPAGKCVKVGGKRPQKTTAYAAVAAQAELFDSAPQAASVANGARGHGSETAACGAVGQPYSGVGAVPAFTYGGGASAAVLPPHVWVDGIPMAKRLPFAHEGIVCGDGTSLAIAMASIWAKVTRDRLLAQLAEQFPHYGWETNAGYGTKPHIGALRAHGACCHHRPKFLQKQGLGGHGA